MPPENRTIIADAPSARRRVGLVVFGGALAIGTAAALHFARLGLTLSHYDARAHLVVARRLIDSLTPGWRQLGAVWLPLPHLLNALPVQLDWNFRTGSSAVVISMLALAWGLSALARYLLRHTGSTAAAIAAPTLLLLNPDVLYLQSTPLTEPLLFGLALVSLLAVDDWIAAPDSPLAHRAGLRLAALVLTRYEGWLIGAVLIALALVARPRARTVFMLALYPLAAIAAFFYVSYVSSGVLLVTSGFYVPNNPARGDVTLVLDGILAATRNLAGPLLMAGGALGIGVALWRARPTGGRSLLPLSLLAAGVLPFGAFYAGHPERVRYMVPLVVAAAALSGLGLAAVPRRVRTMAAAVFAVAVMVLRPPLSPQTPMLTEAQWEQPYREGRRAVIEHLRQAYDGTPILASMSSLAHFMQESSAIGLQLRNFLHEGNGDLWIDAFGAPRHHVRWVLVEEQAEGGDALAIRLRDDPSFLDGFTRVVFGGGLALYWRPN